MSARIMMGLAIGLVTTVVATGCDRKEEPTTTRVAPPTVESAKPAQRQALEYVVAHDGVATFLIDAPLEKIKGRATTFRGTLSLDPTKLGDIRGQVDVDLGTLVTETFDDEKKNTTQTEHARNWLELGADVEPGEREENQWARFTIRSAKVEPASLLESKTKAGKRQAHATAEGDFWLHGVSVRRSVKLIAELEGPADAPRLVSVKTEEPLRVSLREHDVKPRDVTGKLLKGALERVGDKIVDEVQISLVFSADRGKEK